MFPQIFLFLLFLLSSGCPLSLVSSQLFLKKADKYFLQKVSKDLIAVSNDIQMYSYQKLKKKISFQTKSLNYCSVCVCAWMTRMENECV